MGKRRGNGIKEPNRRARRKNDNKSKGFNNGPEPSGVSRAAFITERSSKGLIMQFGDIRTDTVREVGTDLAVGEFTKAIHAFSESRPGSTVHKVRRVIFPDLNARAGGCIENSMAMAARNGGDPQTGWYFLLFSPPGEPEQFYLRATHHCVYRAPNGDLRDVTPPTGSKTSDPYEEDDAVVFLNDSQAEPVLVGHPVIYPAPLANRFLPITNQPELLTYVNEIQEEENQRWEEWLGSLQEKYGVAQSDVR